MIVATLLFVACGSNWSHPERMTNKQLIAEAQKQNKHPVGDFFIPDDFDVEIEAEEMWYQIWLNSASTVEEARNEVEAFTDMQSTSSHEITYIGENNYFYQFKLKYSGKNFPEYVYTYRIVVWKNSALFCTFNNQDGYCFEIKMLDNTSVRNILDLNFYIYNYLFQSGRIIHRELTEDANYFYYTFYEISITYGDWGLYNTANLEKRQSRINKQTGELEMHYFSKNIKSVTIPGTRNDGGVIE